LSKRRVFTAREAGQNLPRQPGARAHEVRKLLPKDWIASAGLARTRFVINVCHSVCTNVRRRNFTWPSAASFAGPPPGEGSGPIVPSHFSVQPLMFGQMDRGTVRLLLRRRPNRPLGTPARVSLLYQLEVKLKAKWSLGAVAGVLTTLASAGAVGQDTPAASSASQTDTRHAPGIGSASTSASGRALSILVAPSDFGNRDDFAEGCWIRLYDGADYVGEKLTLVGPLAVSEMSRVSPSWRRWNSVVVGPSARLTIYSGAAFARRSTSLKPLQRAPDLASKDVDWYGRIESARVECTRQ
jgi:hypothetical protein